MNNADVWLVKNINTIDTKPFYSRFEQRPT